MLYYIYLKSFPLINTLDSNKFSSLVIQGLILLVAIIWIARLFSMQILDQSYVARAKENFIREKVIYPSRGLVLDRHGNIIVNNEPVYDLIVTPYKVQSVDTNSLCNLLNISVADFRKDVQRMENERYYRRYLPQVLRKQIPHNAFAAFQEHLYQFPGFEYERRTVRQYTTPNAAHVLGYIGEVNQQVIDSSNYYKLRDYIGISGIERTYELALRGKKGLRKVEVDAYSREVNDYNEGKSNENAQPGQNLTLTLDMKLQQYAEQLMNNKKGSIVAIEPSTGEILSLVSSPSYNPNLLTGRRRGAGMWQLQQDTLKPLFNRATMAYYPPGSIFKPLMGLLALHEEVIVPKYYYGCNGGYRLGRLTVGCHYHASCFSVAAAIEHSCNAYFCHIFKLFVEQDKYKTTADGLMAWHNHLNDFGLGTDIYLDLPSTLTGYVPDSIYYNKLYKNKYWGAGTIISLGIGQGELGVTPVQMAHMTAIIANRGRFYYPHLIRPSNSKSLYVQPQSVSIAPQHFEPIIDGMERVVRQGTGTKAYIAGLDVCGKTGTAQNPHGEDHSVFIAFAPKENPQIAIAVIVENGGFGSNYAAPIASLIIEKYLNQEISEGRKWLETKMLEANLIVPKKKAVVIPTPNFTTISPPKPTPRRKRIIIPSLEKIEVDKVEHN